MKVPDDIYDPPEGAVAFVSFLKIPGREEITVFDCSPFSVEGFEMFLDMIREQFGAEIKEALGE